MIFKYTFLLFILLLCSGVQAYIAETAYSKDQSACKMANINPTLFTRNSLRDFMNRLMKQIYPVDRRALPPSSTGEAELYLSIEQNDGKTKFEIRGTNAVWLEMDELKDLLRTERHKGRVRIRLPKYPIRNPSQAELEKMMRNVGFEDVIFEDSFSFFQVAPKVITPDGIR